MRIVIVGGDHKADFLIGLLLKHKHKLTVINKSEEVCNKLATKHHISVIRGDATNLDLLRNANIENADILVALTPNDAKNFAICRMAEDCLGISKSIASIKNPANGPIFEKLGVDKTISDSFEAASLLSKATLISNLENSLDIADGKASISELIVTADSPIAHKSLAEIKLEDANICAIIREDKVVIPKGRTTILENDTLVVICDPNSLESVSKQIVGE